MSTLRKFSNLLNEQGITHPMVGRPRTSVVPAAKIPKGNGLGRGNGPRSTWNSPKLKEKLGGLK